MRIEVRADWGTTLLNSEHFNLVWIRVYRKPSQVILVVHCYGLGLDAEPRGFDTSRCRRFQS